MTDQSNSAARRGSRSRRFGLGLLLGLLIGAGLGLLLGALALGDGRDGNREAVRGSIFTTPLQRIVTNPAAHYGESVGVTGQVREILSPRAFTVGQQGFFGPDLLVVTQKPLAAPTGRSGSRPVLEGDLVSVAGDVRKFDLSTFEREAGRDLRREFDSFIGDDLSERRNDPAILADAVTFSSRGTLVAEAGDSEEVAERPDDFYGKVVSVRGRVSDVLSSGALVLDDRLVALTADLGERRPRKGEMVKVLGPVRPFDPDQLRVRGISFPDDDFLGNLANQPAVVGQSIEIE